MARGGSRPGAGRPRLTDEEKAKRVEARKAKRKTSGKPPKAKKTAGKSRPKRKEGAGFAPGGVKSADAPSDWPFGTQPPQPEVVAPPAQSESDQEPVIGADADTPLGFLLEVMKETRLKLSVRMQAAAIGAQYMHAKPVQKGKKEEAADRVGKAGGGKFAPPQGPRLAVNNNR